MLLLIFFDTYYFFKSLVIGLLMPVLFIFLQPILKTGGAFYERSENGVYSKEESMFEIVCALIKKQKL